MRVILESELGAYLLIPCNKRIASKMIHTTGDESVLFQTDWDYPALASALGWRGLRSKKCPHDSTDGTVDCHTCGKTASQFIAEAREWLSDHVGQTFNRPVNCYFEVNQ